MIKEYRHCRMVFGLNCSPFMLAAVIEHHLNGVPSEDKDTAKLLKKSLYVDNCVVSLDTVEEYKRFREKTTAIMMRAQMELRQWEHSSVEETRVGPTGVLPPGCGLGYGSNCDPQALTTVLSIKWNKDEDFLYCQITKNLTEDRVLSTVSKIFDPIGFTCPALLQPKVMLQDSWAVQIGWDKEWDAQETSRSRKWWEDVGKLSKIHIPRKAFGEYPRGRIEIHCFSDASKDAYAAVVFARVDIQDKVSVQLLMAKTRLAPLDKKKTKRVTIPRLELLGCVIGSRLTAMIKQALSVEISKTYFWSDSSTALAWIRRDEDWGTFVGNRVREINRLTHATEWRHVPGKLNPADLKSRGCSPTELLESKWWEGPSWLKQEESFWPSTEEMPDEQEVDLEKRKTQIVMKVTPIAEPPIHSSYIKNVRVAGWVRRFVSNLRRKITDRSLGKYLGRTEILEGERDVIYQMQQRHYGENPSFKNLRVEKKEDGLWHVKTRLTYKNDADQFKSPILIPREDPLVIQLIEFIHKAFCHAGAQFVLGRLREKYWIIQGRKTVSSVIHKCVICRRYASKAMPCDPAPLPLSRIETSFAFQTTGVDLAGPLYLKGGKKSWVVLYTCAVCRGVYLDVVDSLSAEEFLDSLEKFTHLIGRPNQVFSDNGTNFVGARNMIEQLDWVKNKLEEKLEVRRIEWTFIPPSAPWWGGWWERLVRTLKELLKKILGTVKLTRKQLEICLASVTYTINNRPLTTLTEDIEDLMPLTPAMFMKDLPVSGLPERELITSRDLQECYAKVNALKKALRERFRKEYLAMLVQKKNEKTTPDPEVGDVVLVGQDNKKRFEWPLGRILELYPGKDGKVRVAKIKTKNGTLVRPLQRLYPLEVPSPKSIDAASSVKSLAREAEAMADQFEEEQEAVPIIKTRTGRQSKKPSRYGQWNR